MLTADLSIVRYERGQAIPDRLTRVTHKHYLEYAQRMLGVYASGIGRARRELHQSVRNILSAEPDCDRRRIGAFCKLLDDAGEFERDRRGAAAALRLEVFALAAASHPLVTEPDHVFERTERETKSAIAAKLGRSWAEIDGAMYTDVIDRQPLLRFDGLPSPEALLSRYNLAQLQACLYKARSMTVEAGADFAAIVRYAKLARLLVETRRLCDVPSSSASSSSSLSSSLSSLRYRIDVSGPTSVLRETQRYGVLFARFLAALVACRDWRMEAVVATPWGRDARLRVCSEDGYRSHVTSPAAFDSDVEAALAKRWGDDPAARGGWQLLRDAGILQQGQMTFVPDFLLRHADGREVFLEIVGFWTPEYLAAKRKTIGIFRDRRIVLAVQERSATATAKGASAIGRAVVVYKTRLDPDAIVAAAGELCRGAGRM